MKNYISLLIILLINIDIYSQVYLYEGFENGTIPTGWSQEFESGAINWRYEDGGYTTTPGIPNSRKPPAAFEGEFNALYQFQTLGNERTKLTTKKLADMEFGIKPVLKFYHAQYAWQHGANFYNDELRVYYKNHIDSSWIMLKEYTLSTTSWEERIIPLPDSTLSEDYYLSFEAKSNWGWGVCLDSIYLYETGIVDKRLDTVAVKNYSNSSIPSGSQDVPLLQFTFKVFGNQNTCVFDSLVVSSLCTDDADIANNGLKIYFSEDPIFTTDNLVATTIGFTDGKAVFNNMGLDLPTGYSYAWLTADISNDGGHNNIVDVKLDANSFLINNDLYPATNLSPSGSRKVLESIFFEDFENPSSWIITGEFQFAQPRGLGGFSGGNKDPDNAISDTTVLGVDLTGLGAYFGDYEAGIGDREYQAISPVFNLKYYNDVILYFSRFLNIANSDQATIDVSTDNGATWDEAWNNQSIITDNDWTNAEVDVSDFATREDSVRIRFTLGPTTGIWQLSGWNIDDFYLTGNFLDYDLGIVGIDAPFDKCGHSSEDSISVWVKNYAGKEVYDTLPIPIYYRLNGNINKVYDTVYANIGIEDSVRIKLNIPIDLSSPDIYSFQISTDLSLDEDLSNNDFTKDFYAFPSHVPGYTEKFEVDEGVWKDYGDVNSWQRGFYSLNMLPAVDGSVGWATGLLSNYLNNESSYLETGCYDLADGNRHFIEFNYWMDVEENIDGFNVEYSIDEGETWVLIDTNEFNWDFGWYSKTDMVSALGEIGFSGNSGGWVKTRQLLPEHLNTEPKVKFRFHFQSDGANTSTGVGIDNFRIYKTPDDLGVSSIDSVSNDCQYINQNQVSVSVTNYGLNAVQAGNSIIIGYNLSTSGTGNDYTTSATDTIILQSDLPASGVIKHKFQETYDNTLPGSYTIKAFTLSDPDPWTGFNNNDTSELTYQVLPIPETGLQDTLTTKEAWEEVLRANYSINYTYDWVDINGTHSSADTLKTVGPGVYYLTLTDVGGNGCAAYDSVFVELLFNDAGVDSILNPFSACEQGGSEEVTIRIRNYGTDSILVGELMTLYVEMGGNSYNEDFTLDQVIYRGEAIEHTVSGVFLNLADTGWYSIKSYVDLPGDTIALNDTVVQQIHVHGYPVVELGAPVVVEGYSYTINAPQGYAGYLWDNGDTTYYHDVETDIGYHTVGVMNKYGCVTTDSVYVWLKQRDIRPLDLVAPTSSCEVNSAVQVWVQVDNNGNDTIKAGEDIYLSYKINDGARVNQTVTISEDIEPGDPYDFIFTQSEDFSLPGVYDIEFTATTLTELTLNNDTTIEAITIDDNPNIELGADQEVFAYNYLLDATNDGGWSYNWTLNGSSVGSEQTYNLTNTGINTVGVTVTDTITGCSTQDNVQISLFVIDLEPTGTNIDLTVCKGESIVPKLTVKQAGNYASSSGIIKIKYGISGVNEIQDDKPIVSLSQNQTVDITLNTALDFNETSNDLFFIIDYTSSNASEYDMNTSNDTLTSRVFATEPPKPSLLGAVNDTIGVSTFPDTIRLSNNETFASYIWNDNASETEPEFIVNTEGYCSVTVTDNFGCEATARAYVHQPTSVQYFSANLNEVAVFPIPGSTTLNIHLKLDMPEDIMVDITNINGQLLRQYYLGLDNNFVSQIDISSLPSGIYLMTINGKEKLYQQQIIIMNE